MRIIGKSWLTLLVALIPAVVLSQGLKEASGKLGAMQGQGVALSSSLGGVTGTVVTMVLSLVGTIFFVLMIYGGFVWIKAAGRDDEIARAKRIVVTAIIGLFVVLSSYGITNFVLNRMGGSGECSGTCISTDLECFDDEGQGTCPTGQHCCQ